MKPVLILLVAAPVFLASCGGDKPRPAEAAGKPPVAVRTVTAEAREWPAVYEATGVVRARTVATISAKVMGYVQQVAVQVGDRVSAGQLLVSLDSRDMDSNVLRAEAARAEVQSAIAEADSGAASAKANLDLAQSTFRRMEDLAAKKSISSQEFDEASARLKAAQASYEMARARRAQVDSKMAQVEQEIRAARIMREYARIAAPFGGLVTAKSVEQGNLATPGAPLLTIEQDGAYRLEASVEESRIGAVRVGQLNARVSEIVPVVDAQSRASIVKIDLPAMPQLRSGMFGRAGFPLAKSTAVAAPPSALVERGQLQSMFVAEDGVAHARLVTVGRRTKEAIEVLSGLNAGEKIVAPAPPGLEDGARLEVRQ
jgi:RND family efflux transporter MFP subunit